MSGLKPALRQEVLNFVATTAARNAATFANKRTSRQLRRESLQDIWDPLVMEESKAYRSLLDDKNFIAREKEGYIIHPETCRYAYLCSKLTTMVDHLEIQKEYCISFWIVLQPLPVHSPTPSHLPLTRKTSPQIHLLKKVLPAIIVSFLTHFRVGPLFQRAARNRTKR